MGEGEAITDEIRGFSQLLGLPQKAYGRQRSQDNRRPLVSAAAAATTTTTTTTITTRWPSIKYVALEGNVTSIILIIILH